MSSTRLQIGKAVITARVVMSPLIPADEPVLAGDRASNQFYAEPIDGSDQYFTDADGMSGGPVFTLKKVDMECWIYGVIGVQSAWYPTSKTFAVCPFSSFRLALEEVVAEARAMQANDKD